MRLSSSASLWACIAAVFISSARSQQRTGDFGCAPDRVSFEILTGYVYTGPADVLDSQPGTLMLTDCIDTCRANATCRSVTYETGLCVLFSSNADGNDGQLSPSQFPVFTIYAQKTCLPSASNCDAAWSFERVMNHELAAEVRKRGAVETRQQCSELCLAEQDFDCRAASFTSATGDCRLFDQDRHSMAGQPVFGPSAEEGVDYLEANCGIDEPKKLCLYDETKGKILKTVDSVYQAIASREDCEDLCNNAPFRCHSYDFNDTGDNVCRLSHHSAHTLTQIEEPYLAIEEATTYEKDGCYDVAIECQSSTMTANIMTSALFGGKIYAKGSPVTCVEDVDDALKFSITMGYNDLECGVEREAPGVYSNEVIIQHHDRIVTSSDLGLSLTCQYDLTNKSVSNTVDLAITGEISPSLYEEATVDSPNVLMRVENYQREDTKTAVVGDPLTMIFEILDVDSPYEIFVRDLVAVDGATDTELLLIDERGCPTEPSIMSELSKSEETEKMLEASFDAFRFPSSQMVQFRAMVTPCMPKCEPVQCDITDYTGQSRTVDSYGRRKRDLGLVRRKRRTAEMEEALVVSTLHIVDRLAARDSNRLRQRPNSVNDVGFKNATFNEIDHSVVYEHDLRGTAATEEGGERCVNETSLITGAVIFLIAQGFLLLLWTCLWKRRRSAMAKEVVGYMPEVGSSSDSLSYIYDAGIPKRMN